ADAIAEVAEAVRELSMPVLLAWGGRDPVFRDDFAEDLADRLPHADRHRFARAGHLVVAEADVAGLVDAWLDDRVVSPRQHNASAPSTAPTTPAASPAALWSALESRRGDD